MFGFSSLLFAQNITVQGVVTDSNGEFLPGATVRIKGTNRGTITDFDGKFIIDNVDKMAILVFSYVGFVLYLKDKRREIFLIGNKPNYTPKSNFLSIAGTKTSSKNQFEF
jgi:hypothetical protein